MKPRGRLCSYLDSSECLAKVNLLALNLTETKLFLSEKNIDWRVDQK